MSLDEQCKHVQENVHRQVCQISEAMDAILLIESHEMISNERKTSEAKRDRLSGLSFAVGGSRSKLEQQKIPAIAKTRPLKRNEVSAAFKEHLSYTLELRRSQLIHEAAGQGVYLDGTARPGAVVSMYPGIIYSPSQYRYMPGYPRVDDGNPYLISRYDGLIIDGKPWGCGEEVRALWNGICQNDTHGKVLINFDELRETSESEKLTQAKDRKKPGLLQILGGAKESYGSRKGAILEMRNPLALAHFVNHPAKGMQPNVMVCPYDFPASNLNIRPYIPNVHFDDEAEVMRRHGLVWLRDRSGDKNLGEENHGECPLIRTLVLIATRDICDEELFLNYRLSNPKQWPKWYYPVNQKEDLRRWD